MVCSHCGSIGHNKRTCLKSSEATSPEKRAAKALASLLPPPNKMKKVSKPLEGLTGCQNIWKEPKGIYIKKKVSKPLEGLTGCQNIWKEPKGIYIKKKVSKPLEGLTGCQNIWKEPKGIYIKKKVNRTPLTGEGVCDYQLVPLDSTALKGASGMIQLPPPRPRSTKSQ